MFMRHINTGGLDLQERMRQWPSSAGWQRSHAHSPQLHNSYYLVPLAGNRENGHLIGLLIAVYIQVVNPAIKA